MWNPAGKSAVLALALSLALACGSDGGGNDDGDSGGGATGTVPDMYQSFTNITSIAVEGEFVVIRTADRPNHKSVYFPTSDTQYEPYNGNNPSFMRAPNTIASQQLVFRIPLHPAKAAGVSETPLGPIGIATNGIAIFNQYAAGRSPLAGEINSFDQWSGHPQQMGQYHYHVEPTWLTRSDRSAMVGVLLDGFPVYGPLENGKLLTTADLDAAHGHTAATREFPNGIYHYHTTADAPYINGSGFVGTPGTVGQ